MSRIKTSIPFGRRSVALNRIGARERSYLAFCDRVCLFDTGSRVEGPAERNLGEVAIPRLGSLYLTHSWDGEVKGQSRVQFSIS